MSHKQYNEKFMRANNKPEKIDMHKDHGDITTSEELVVLEKFNDLKKN